MVELVLGELYMNDFEFARIQITFPAAEQADSKVGLRTVRHFGEPDESGDRSMMRENQPAAPDAVFGLQYN